MSCCMEISRRQFITTGALGMSAVALGAAVAAERSLPSEESVPAWDPDRPQIVTGRKLVVQPLLRHDIETPKPRTSWRNWGGVHTEESARQEQQRITAELGRLQEKAEFPLQILPLAVARNDQEAAHVRDTSPADVLLLYAAGARWLDPCITRKRHTIILVRHRSGPRL